MHRYSGQEDLVLCTPASGRHRSQTKELIGYFNNILPMRFDLGGDPTFVEVLRRTRRVALDAFKYQDLPFQVIADSPNLKAVSPQPGAVLPRHRMAAEAHAVGPDVRGVGGPHRRLSDFDLSVSLWKEGEELRGVFEYKTELFDEDTIARMIADYLRIAGAARR